MQTSNRGAIPIPGGFHQHTATGAELETGRTGFPSPPTIGWRRDWPASSDRSTSWSRSRSIHYSKLPTSVPQTGILGFRHRSTPPPLGASARPRQRSRATFDMNHLHRAAPMSRRGLISVPVRNHQTMGGFSLAGFLPLSEQDRRAGDVEPGF